MKKKYVIFGENSGLWAKVQAVGCCEPRKTGASLRAFRFEPGSMPSLVLPSLCCLLRPVFPTLAIYRKTCDFGGSLAIFFFLILFSKKRKIVTFLAPYVVICDFGEKSLRYFVQSTWQHWLRQKSKRKVNWKVTRRAYKAVRPVTSVYNAVRFVTSAYNAIRTVTSAYKAVRTVTSA